MHQHLNTAVSQVTVIHSHEIVETSPFHIVNIKATDGSNIDFTRK